MWVPLSDILTKSRVLATITIFRVIISIDLITTLGSVGCYILLPACKVEMPVKRYRVMTLGCGWVGISAYGYQIWTISINVFAFNIFISGPGRKLGNLGNIGNFFQNFFFVCRPKSKTRNSISEVSEISKIFEFLICIVFIFFLKFFFFFYKCFFKICILHL